MALTRLGSKAITSVENTAINLDAAEIPNLDAAKITSGQFADARIAASNVSQHAQSFDDNKIVNDISTLALRQASNENKAAYNTNSMYVDVFQDSSGITNLTNSVRNSSEFIHTFIEGDPTYLDYFNPTQVGGGTAPYTITTSNRQGTDLSNADITSSSNQFIDFNRALNIGSSGGSYPFYTRTMGNSSYAQYDYKENKVFSGKLAVGKAPTWGDLNQAKLEYSTDGTNFTAINLSNASVLGDNPVRSLTEKTSGAASNFAADGTFNWGTTSNLGTGNVVNFGITLQNVPAFTARYIRYYAMSKHSYTDTGYGILTPYLQNLTANATGSFESNAITAPSSVNKMGAIITYQDNLGTNALNTDIVLKLSADGGSNYSTATLTAMPDFASGIKMAKVNDLSVQAGTSLKYKIEFANQATGSKEARIRGCSLQF